MPPQTQPPRPEHRAPQGRPAPGRGLGSQQRTTRRAAPAHARSPSRARPLSKHSDCAPPARPRLPFPRYSPRAHLGLCGHPPASLGLGLRIPVTSLACHRRNCDPGDSRSPVCSAGLGKTGSARPSVCHLLSPAAGLTNEQSGWRHGGQFLAQGAGRKVGGGSCRAEGQWCVLRGAGLGYGRRCLSPSPLRSHQIAVLQKSSFRTADVPGARLSGP